MQLRQQEDQLSQLNVDVCIVTFETDVLAMSYVRETDLAWPLLVDADRKLYAAYGMNRGSWWKIFGPASILAYLKLLFRGRRLQRSASDVFQLGGDVLIDPDGVVRFHRVGAGPADRPEIAALLDAVRN